MLTPIIPPAIATNKVIIILNKNETEKLTEIQTPPNNKMTIK